MKKTNLIIYLSVICLILIMNVFFSQFAIAGTEEEPEITDQEDDTDDQPGDNNEHLDIVAGWFFDETATEFKIAIQIKNIAEYESDTDYVFRWHYNDTEYFAMLDVEEDLNFYYGRIISDGANTNYQIDGETTGSGEIGERAKIIITVPKEGVGSPEKGESLEDPNIETHRETTVAGTTNKRQIDNTENGKDYELIEGGEEQSITMTCSSPSKQVSSGGSVNFEITVSSNSEKDIEVELSVTDPLTNWEAELDLFSVTVSFNNHSTVILNVTVAKNADDDEKVDFTIFATSSIGDTTINITATAIKDESEDDDFIPGFDIIIGFIAISSVIVLVKKKTINN